MIALTALVGAVRAKLWHVPLVRRPTTIPLHSLPPSGLHSGSEHEGGYWAPIVPRVGTAAKQPRTGTVHVMEQWPSVNEMIPIILVGAICLILPEHKSWFTRSPQA